MMHADLHIDSEAGRAVRSGYPHVPRENLVSRTRGLENGAVVDVFDGRGFAARGLYDETSPAAVRVLTRDKKEPLDGTFWRKGIDRALDLRKSLSSLSVTDAWRAVNSEGDGLAGLVVETFSSYAVLRLETEALRPHMGPIVDAVRGALQPRGLYEKRTGPDGGRGHHLGGSTAPDSLPVREGNLRFLVRLAEGEKTGLFLDQREARRVIARYSRGRQVANCFSFTGTASLVAAAAGASRVVSIDPSPRSIGSGRENFAANGLPPESHEFVAGDPREVLGRIAASSRRFDLAIVDSPCFGVRPAPAAAKGARKEKKAGKKPSAKKPARRGKKRRMGTAGGGADPVALFRSGYVDLLGAISRVLTPHGLVACTVHERKIAYRDFLAVLREAAALARVDIQVLEVHGLPPDFPVNPGYPQGEYLRFVVCALRAAT
jgi:23S rRNA (cytosine1962-C5)-methyltransferase